jgi:hypothetical protein
MSIKIGNATVIADDLGLTAGDSTLDSLTVANETTTTSLLVTGNNIPRLTLSNPQYDAATYRLETSFLALNISNVLNGVSRPIITIEDNGHVSIPDGNLTVAQGNLLVGKTVTTLNTPGNVLYEAGAGQFTVSNGISMYLNRTGASNGDILGFYKDGTTVGSIGSLNGVAGSYFGTGTTAISAYSGALRAVDGSTGSYVDNTINIGTASSRFKDLYLSGGVYLGGTDAANKLDDYESGTWTPTFDGFTVTNATGRYIKVGKQVTIWFDIVNGTSSGSTGQGFQMYGLPFSLDVSTAGSRPVGSVIMFYSLGLGLSHTPAMLVSTGAATSLRAYYTATSGYGDVTVSRHGGTSYMFAQMTYTTT